MTMVNTRGLAFALPVESKSATETTKSALASED
jgi:hypothetical protein